MQKNKSQGNIDIPILDLANLQQDSNTHRISATLQVQEPENKILKKEEHSQNPHQFQRSKKYHKTISYQTKKNQEEDTQNEQEIKGSFNNQLKKLENASLNSQKMFAQRNSIKSLPKSLHNPISHTPCLRRSLASKLGLRNVDSPASYIYSGDSQNDIYNPFRTPSFKLNQHMQQQQQQQSSLIKNNFPTSKFQSCQWINSPQEREEHKNMVGSSLKINNSIKLPKIDSKSNLSKEQKFISNTKDNTKSGSNSPHMVSIQCLDESLSPKGKQTQKTNQNKSEKNIQNSSNNENNWFIAQKEAAQKIKNVKLLQVQESKQQEFKNELKNLSSSIFLLSDKHKVQQILKLHDDYQLIEKMDKKDMDFYSKYLKRSYKQIEENKLLNYGIRRQQPRQVSLDNVINLQQNLSEK